MSISYGSGTAEGRDIDPDELEAATSDEPVDEGTAAKDDGGGTGSNIGSESVTFPRGPDPALAEETTQNTTEEQFREPATAIRTGGTLITSETGSVGVKEDLARRVVSDIESDAGDLKGDGDGSTTGLDDSGNPRTQASGVVPPDLLPQVAGGGSPESGSGAGGGGLGISTLAIAGAAVVGFLLLQDDGSGGENGS